MTTIVFDGQILAADSLVVTSDSAFRFMNKIVELDSTSGFSLCGEAQDIFLAKEWFESDRKGEKPKLSEHCSGLFWDAGTLYAFEDKLTLMKVDRAVCYADGSGWKWAMAAMDHGKNAIEAVEYAGTKDCSTGGKVYSVRLA